MIEVHPDTGSEFINWHMKSCCDAEKISMTRSRPNHKNDNMHVEERNGHVIRKMIGYITLDNDPKRNALSFDLLNELLEAFNALKKEKVRVVILRSNKGAKVWSAGFNIDELPKDGSDPLAYDNPLQRVIRAIQNFPLISGTVTIGVSQFPDVRNRPDNGFTTIRHR